MHLLDPAQKARVLELLEERTVTAKHQNARDHFLPFVEEVWPGFIRGAHHVLMAEAFEKIASGEWNRLIISMPPRFTKSQFASWLLPAWFLGKFPAKKIIQASNTENLAAGFGRQVRNLVSREGKQTDDKGDDPYHEIFPEVDLSKDSQAAGSWHTNRGGSYFAVGVNGRVTGIGGDIIIIDDPHDEQQAKQAESNPEIFDSVSEWFTSGPRQRLQPGGAIIIVMTRWSKRDLAGQVLRKMERDIAEGRKPGTYDHWQVINLPAILDQGTPTERSMWPGFWTLEALQATRNALPVPKWEAQYQQNPTSEQSAIFKREYWRMWGASANEGLPDGIADKCPSPNHAQAWRDNSPPACKYTIGSWDCASSKNERSHPSAYTLWGVFEAEDPATGNPIDNIILLYAYQARMEFPELKKKAKDFYDEDMPDTLLIENKSAGMQLLQEFRSMGVPAESFSGSNRGNRVVSNDKISRANRVVDIFASKYVWRPDTRYADEVVEQMGSFPNDADDLVDSTVQAMLRFREGGFIRTANDEDEKESQPRARRKRYY